MNQTRELPETIESELIELKDKCWEYDNKPSEDNFEIYRNRVEELHKDGFHVNVFLGVANNLQRKLNGYKSYKGTTIKESSGRINESKLNRNGLWEISGYGAMLLQQNNHGFKIYLGRNNMDKSEIIELWVPEKNGRHIEIKYSSETKDYEHKRLFKERDKILKRRGI